MASALFKSGPFSNQISNPFSVRQTLSRPHIGRGPAITPNCTPANSFFRTADPFRDRMHASEPRTCFQTVNTVPNRTPFQTAHPARTRCRFRTAHHSQTAYAPANHITVPNRISPPNPIHFSEPRPAGSALRRLLKPAELRRAGLPRKGAFPAGQPAFHDHDREELGLSHLPA